MRVFFSFLKNIRIRDHPMKLTRKKFSIGKRKHFFVQCIINHNSHRIGVMKKRFLTIFLIKWLAFKMDATNSFVFSEVIIFTHTRTHMHTHIHTHTECWFVPFRNDILKETKQLVHI